jgi:hypothetical protein
MLLAAALVLAVLAFVLGAAWDIQWHYAIGRDRPFIPPHLLLLGGIALTGTLALAGVVHAWLARDSERGGESGGRVRLVGRVRAPVGLYLAGVGALCAALAFPWDDYWHRLYGVDVTIWAPFHVMIVGGMALAALGAAYHFAAQRGFAASIGTAAALATGAAVLLLLQAQALDREGIVAVQPRPTIVFPPLLAGLTLPWLVAAALAARLPRALPGGATLVALALAGIRLGLLAFIPGALRWAAALDGARVREQHMIVIATPFAFPAWAVAAAVVIDAAWWLVRSRRLRITAPLALAIAGAVAGLVLASLDRPWERTLPLVRGGRLLDLRAAFWHALPAVAAIGAVGALYGAALGGALASLTTGWTASRARGVAAVLGALALGLAGAAAWSAYLAAQGVIGPAHPPLLPFLPARPVTPHWVGWIIGLVPAWGMLAVVVTEAFGLRGPRLALPTRGPAPDQAPAGVEPAARLVTSP